MQKKKMAKIKIDFLGLFGVGGAGWRCRSFFTRHGVSNIGG
jgi:hypothetical protein